jgi:hypothetical protein
MRSGEKDFSNGCTPMTSNHLQMHQQQYMIHQHVGNVGEILSQDHNLSSETVPFFLSFFFRINFESFFEARCPQQSCAPDSKLC